MEIEWEVRNFLRTAVQVDLHEISVEYELRHSESLWKRLAEVHPKLHLLDHCSPKQVNEGCLVRLY